MTAKSNVFELLQLIGTNAKQASTGILIQPAFLKSISSPGQNETSRFGQEHAGTKLHQKAGNTVQSAFLKSISQSAHCVNTVLQVIVIKFDAENQQLPAGYKVPTKQVIVLDVSNQAKDSTFWTHKPKNVLICSKQQKPQTRAYLMESVTFCEASNSVI